MPAPASIPAGWTYIGDDENGENVFQLVDAGGNTVQWKGLQADDLRNLGRSPFGTYVEDRWNFVGTATDGKPAYQLVDEGGNTVQFEVPTSSATTVNLGPVGITAYMPPAVLSGGGSTVTTGGGGNGTTGGTTGITTPVTTSTSSNLGLLLALGAVAWIAFGG